MINIKENEPLNLHTTFKAGGEVLFFVEIFSREDLIEAITFADRKNLEIVALGGGSNTLFKDGLQNKIVIKVSIDGIEEEEFNEGVLIKAGAGVAWDKLVSYSTEKNLWGLENLSAIPGAVGGACVQNIGAYGAELKDTIKEVSVFDLENKNFVQLQKDECSYGYRDSIFKNKKRYLVLDATFLLNKIPTPKIEYKDLQKFFLPAGRQVGVKIPQTSEEVREAVISIRSKKFPDLNEFGTAGSFFKIPVVDISVFDRLIKDYPQMPAHETNGKMKLSTAWILDKVLNLKGYTEGQISLWKEQPLVVVNNGGKSSEEIILFTEKIKSIVFDRLGINLEEEVIII